MTIKMVCICVCVYLSVFLSLGFDTVGWAAGRHPARKKWGMVKVATG